MPHRPRTPEWDEYVQRLGLTLQRLRIRLGMSQEDVAYAAGLTRSHYQQLEKGRSRPDTAANPSLYTLASLASVLNVDIRELLPATLDGVDDGSSVA